MPKKILKFMLFCNKAINKLQNRYIWINTGMNIIKINKNQLIN